MRRLALGMVVCCWAACSPGGDTPTVGETPVRIARNKVDILFMVDDSPGTPEGIQLIQRFPDLLKILDDFGKITPAWYHIGVVTSDLGAGRFTLGLGQCHPGGRGGSLQALGAAADVTCQPPGNGLSFIDHNQIDGTDNLPPGQSLATTFNCMASVGTSGCGFEQPLEAVYLALHDPPAENHDFLRTDALLVVLYLTDEDDCSADSDTDLFDPDNTAPPPVGYGPLVSYRCTQFGIACVDPRDGRLKPMPSGDSGGTWTGCMSLSPSQGGKLTDIQKYIDLFHNGIEQGGLKPDPNDVILAGITAPSSAGASSAVVGSCAEQIGSRCYTFLEHSCVAPTGSSGDPAVRLNQVIGSVANNQLTSICDTSYQDALQSLGMKIVSQLGGGCLAAPVADPSRPDCVVEDVTVAAGQTTAAKLPACDQAAGALPCWRLTSNASCTAVCANDGEPGQRLALTIDRAGPQAANSFVRARCSTVVLPPGARPVCGTPMP